MAPTTFLRAALAGAAAATVWGLQEPLDDRVFRSGYSDVALLGKAVTRTGWWRAAGFAVHAANGALFGAALAAAERATGVRAGRLAVPAALAEHTALFPLLALVDRYHPARGEPGLPPASRSVRVFAQETWRHLLFGAVLAALLGRGDRREEP